MLAEELDQSPHFLEVLGRAHVFGEGLVVPIQGEGEVEALEVFVSPRRPKAGQSNDCYNCFNFI